MQIAIIGAGRLGMALGSALSRAGHHITYAARDPEHARAAADAVGGSAAAGIADAARGAEVVVLAVPFVTAASDVAAELGSVASGKIVIDSTNPLTPEGGLDAFGAESAAVWFASALRDARIVKAFNSVFATIQGDPDLHGIVADGFVAGDDADAKRTVLDLVASIGLRPIDAGPLRHARYLEAISYLGIYLNATNGWPRPWKTAWKLVGAPVAEPDQPD